MKDDYYMLKVEIAATEQALESIVRRALKLPDEQRQPLRHVYVRKAGQLADARDRLALLDAHRDEHQAFARRFA